MVNESGDVPVIVAPHGKLQGSRWLLNQERFLIGRGDDCDLIVQDRQVSRHHARIRNTEEGYLLEDLGSKNGTHVNGSLLSEPALLQDGDEIQVALAIKLTFIGTEATLPLSFTEAAHMGLGRLRMDAEAHRVWVNDIEVDPPISPPQFRLLELLFNHSERVVGREEIATYVWPGTHGVGVSDQAIDALVRRLRDRLYSVDPSHNYVETVRGHGFRLANPI